jgi:hypothetical protein
MRLLGVGDCAFAFTVSPVCSQVTGYSWVALSLLGQVSIEGRNEGPALVVPFSSVSGKCFLWPRLLIRFVPHTRKKPSMVHAFRDCHYTLFLLASPSIGRRMTRRRSDSFLPDSSSRRSHMSRLFTQICWTRLLFPY